jgi:hypothetical protein
MTRRGLETVSTESGTEGSSPALSSAESVANLSFLMMGVRLRLALEATRVRAARRRPRCGADKRSGAMGGGRHLWWPISTTRSKGPSSAEAY